MLGANLSVKSVDLQYKIALSFILFLFGIFILSKTRTDECSAF